MSRERWLILYALLAGTLGWFWLILSTPGGVPWPILAFFLILALAVEGAGFRVPPSDPHSLVGIVLLTAALALGPANGALVAAASGLVFGVLLPILYGRPRTFYMLVARPFLRSGVRAGAILLAAAFAGALVGGPPDQATLLLALLLCYPLVVQLSRMLREYLQGGSSGVHTWWRSSWRAMLSAEVAPLPIALLGVAIYQELGLAYFALAGATLLAASLAVRRAAFNLQRQRRSVRELALLNQASRAIIRAEMDVIALCDLIYREASKVVDTSSFHLGLFDLNEGAYTLVVRMQDRVRMPPLIVPLKSNDGIVGWIRETGRSLLVDDFMREMEQLPARPSYHSNRPPRAGIYVPLSVGDTVIGTISIQSYRPRAFDIDDLRMLSLLADQAAIAIDKARAYDQARRRAVQLQGIHEVSQRITAILDLEELLPSVVQLIRERFGYHPVHIFTVEDDQRLMFRASTATGAPYTQLRSMELKLGEGVIGTAAQQRTPLLINNVAQDERYISDDPNTRAELAVPLRFGNQALGVLDLQSAEPNRFTDSDLFVMETLAGQIATAIESARAFTAQREEAWTLNALLQVAENLARASTLDEVLPTAVRLPPLFLGCDRAYCLLWEAERGTFTPLSAYGITREQRAQFVGRAIETQYAPLLVEMLHNPAPVVIHHARTRSAECEPILNAFNSGTLLFAPLLARGTALGLLVADYDAPEVPITARTHTLYTGIANQIAAAIESALLSQEAAEAAHLEEELRVARDIQRALLPSRPPSLPGWEIDADWRAARLVGGDFYDFWFLRPTDTPQQPPGDSQPSGAGQFLSRTEDLQAVALQATSGSQHLVALDGAPDSVRDRPGPLGFVIADVSDKGVPAAMFMALARSLTRAAALDGSPPHVALTRANRWITRDSESAMFVTLFYGILDSERGILRYSCAGHNPPLLVRAADQRVLELSTPGIALGVLEEAYLGEAEVTLEPGDILVCYTDGITEAINSNDEPFGVPRLVEHILAHRHHSASEITSAITRALLAFTGERPPFDDVTLVVIKCAPASAT